jgi:hypothetical protein
LLIGIAEAFKNHHLWKSARRFLRPGWLEMAPGDVLKAQFVDYRWL